MKRILITGVSGFVGSNLVRHFSNQEGLLIFGHGRNSKPKTGEIEMISTCTTEILDELRIDIVIHLAGIAHDLSNTYQPEDYDRVNFQNTCNVFDVFVKSKATKFIFLSSIKAAADTSSVPVTETIAPAPVTAYGKSKQKAEEYIQSVQLDPGKRAYILRPCMIHGQGNKGNLNLLYRYAKTGLPFPFGSFQNKRSFLSMDNLNFIIQSFMEKGIPSGIFHLSDDGYISTRDLYILIAREVGKTPSVWNLPVGVIRLLFSVVGKRAMLNKLTENMLVSNKKISQYIPLPLPLEMYEGLRKTIKSFNGK